VARSRERREQGWKTKFKSRGDANDVGKGGKEEKKKKKKREHQLLPTGRYQVPKPILEPATVGLPRRAVARHAVGAGVEARDLVGLGLDESVLEARIHKVDLGGAPVGAEELVAEIDVGETAVADQGATLISFGKWLASFSSDGMIRYDRLRGRQGRVTNQVGTHKPGVEVVLGVVFIVLGKSEGMGGTAVDVVDDLGAAAVFGDVGPFLLARVVSVGRDGDITRGAGAVLGPHNDVLPVAESRETQPVSMSNY
jgi:hypothetical protein